MTIFGCQHKFSANICSCDDIYVRIVCLGCTSLLCVYVYVTVGSYPFVVTKMSYKPIDFENILYNFRFLEYSFLDMSF